MSFKINRGEGVGNPTSHNIQNMYIPKQNMYIHSNTNSFECTQNVHPYLKVVKTSLALILREVKPALKGVLRALDLDINIPGNYK